MGKPRNHPIKITEDELNREIMRLHEALGPQAPVDNSAFTMKEICSLRQVSRSSAEKLVENAIANGRMEKVRKFTNGRYVSAYRAI